jgi:hypothetical protein
VFRESHGANGRVYTEWQNYPGSVLTHILGAITSVGPRVCRLNWNILYRRRLENVKANINLNINKLCIFHG